MSQHATPRRLPPNPSLEQQKKRARELQRAHAAGDGEAARRLGRHLSRSAGCGEAEILAAPVALHEAQFVIAREYGFVSWAKLKRHIEAMHARQHPFVKDVSYYDDRARGLLSMRDGGLTQALAQIRQWHPRFSGRSDEEIRRAAFSLQDARLVYARQHGCESWEALTNHVQALARGDAAAPFMAAFEALERRDLAALEALLKGDPALANARGTNGNTLLNLACSLLPCAEEPFPGDRLGLVKALLAAGADPNLPNDRGWTPLHQAGYANRPDLAELLLGAGAAVDSEGHGSGGTALAAALFWGHREAAEVLARQGVVPMNLRVAAGLGRRDLVATMFRDDGSLTPQAGAGRGFYRPHSGFPVWEPSDDPQEILDEALIWASKSNRVEVMPLLVERGADPNSDPYRGTPLIWAAVNGRADAAAWLLRHGAEVNRRATFGGPQHGQGVTALHLAAQDGRREMCDLLLRAGADPAIRDELYGGPAEGWAAHGGHKDLAEHLRSVREV